MKKVLTLFLSLLLSHFATAQITDCQTIEAALSGSVPALQPDETGWIDLCPGESLSLNGDALFPQNGMYYAQSVASSDFTWSLGDGTILEGQNVSHVFAQPGAYFVTLFVKDAMGCTSGNDLHLRVRVAGTPALSIVQTPEVAIAGSPVSLKGNVAPPATFSFTDSLFFNIPTALPDGNGAWVTMPVMVSGYPAGAVVQPGQIQSVCLNIEHSWLRDLELWLTCPNGQTAILHNHPGQIGGEVFLGEPNETDEGSITIPGDGYNYRWTPSPQFNQTWIEYSNAFNPYALPAGSYKPYQPLNNLAGCPLNGDWTFTSTDLWAIDNGYLFSWTMTFDTDNFAPPSQEGFSAQVTSAAWQPDNSIIFYSPDSIVAIPQPGSQYVFEAMNEFGCAAEVAENVEVVQQACPGEGSSLEVTDTALPPVTTLAMTDVFLGSGIQLLGYEIEGSPDAMGIFEHGESALCMERGIVLTTGRATSNGSTSLGADGVGTDFASTDNSSTANDPDLAALSASGIFNAAVFTMQFIPSGDSVSFRYLFASEEYPEYACSPFNDVFGFVISGPGINGTFENGGVNLALIPGTNLPVSINNVHPQNGGTCPPAFGEFYNAHQESNEQPVYDGILDVFSAGIAVVPCQTYTIKLMIADAGDGVFDSAVFLEAESFSSNYQEVTDNLPDPTEPLREGCPPTLPGLNFSGLHESQFPISVSISGTATEGTDYLLNGVGSEISFDIPALNFELTVLEDALTEPVEFVQLDFTSACGFHFTHIFALTDALDYTLPADTAICAPNEVTLEVTTGGRDSSFVFSQNDTLLINQTDTVFQSGLLVSGVPFGTLFSPAIIESVCVDVTHNWVDDLDLYLLAPNGRYLELSSDNGLNCDDYNNVCFSPSAALPINYNFPGTFCLANEEASFSNGTFLPEGNWDDLTGTAVNGVWQLVVMDDELGFNGSLNHWSITFSEAAFYQPDVIWSTGETSPFISVSPSASTTYFVQPGNGLCNAWSGSVDVSVIGEDAFSAISGTHCFSENYSVTVNGTVYDSANPAGTEVIPLPDGCDSTVTIDLAFLPAFETDLAYALCDAECFNAPDGSTLCDPGDYAFSLQTASGCDSVVNLHLTQTTLTVSNVLTDCDNSSNFFIVSFNIEGGDPASYLVTPANGTLVGNLFTSNPIPTLQSYEFTVSSGLCEPLNISGIVICDCIANAGAMDPSAIVTCGNGSVTANYDATNESFDSDDGRCFVLHTGSIGIGNILAQSGFPTFSFLPGSMNYGTTYYISAIVGNADGSSCVDLNDPCLSISNGTPVTFFEVTQTDGTASFNHPLCPGDDLQLLASGGTIFQWAGPDGFSSTAQNPVIANLGFTNGGTYTLVVQNGECAEPDSNEILVEFACFTLVDTVLNDESDTLCDLQIAGFVNGCDDGNELVEFSFDPVTNCLIYTGLGPVGIDSICLIAVSLTGDTFALHVVIHALEFLDAGDRLAESGIEIFPNPVSGDFFVKYENAALESLALYDVTGRFLKNVPLGSSPARVSTAGLAVGAYLLRVTTERGVFGRKMVVIR